MSAWDTGSRKRLRRVRAYTWFGTAALGALGLVRPTLTRAITSTLVATVGIAHGATDDAMLDRSGMRLPGGRRMLSAVYGTLAAATYVVARRHPRLASRALFALAWLHFGAGDAAFARACGSLANGTGAALVRGAVPLCIEGRDGRSKATVVGALATAAFHLSSRSYADAVDVALPASLLYIVSGRRKRSAFAIYFGAWHAPRHLALVLERDPRGGAPWQRLGRFARESMPNVAIAVAGGAIAYALRGPQSGDDDAFGALILAITVPHQLAVWWLERDAAKRGRRDRGRS